MKRLSFWMVAAWFFLNGTNLRAGHVRTLYMNDRVMQPIYLAMGRSTVLRFDEKPKNVIIGNSNYFSVEYLNSDVTIQPQGSATTNIFVYAEYQTYGFILKVGSVDQYDDLVHVRWRQGLAGQLAAKEKSGPPLGETRIHRLVVMKDLVRVEVVRKIPSLVQGMSIIELALENLSKETIKPDDIQIGVFANGKKVGSQKFVMRQDGLSPGARSQGRIFSRLGRTNNVEVRVGYRGRSEKIVLPQGVFE